MTQFSVESSRKGNRVKRLFFDRFVDNRNAQSVANSLRKRRFQILLDFLETMDHPISILDVGGTFEYWTMMTSGSRLLDRLRVTLLNIEAPVVAHPSFTAVAGDARSMPQFHNRQFDIVYSNSTIEHVGDFDDQRRMANEIRRIGRYYYMQTPNRYFPVEPHFVFPFFQFLPVNSRVWLVQHFSLGWFPRFPERQDALREVTGIRLLTRTEVHDLFPEAKIFQEHYYGFTKSFVAHTIPQG
jgi:hypothetical protein